MVARAKGYAGKIIGMSQDSHDPSEVADALWSQVALEGMLYGIQVVSVSENTLNQLDSI